MNVGVIGCGAAGMIAAITAARNGHKVTILEHNEVPGRKILATGNGKCNYTNEVMEARFFNEESMALFNDVYSKFSKDETVYFFEKIGIIPYIKNGYYYPRSEQASSVVECLINTITDLKITVVYGCNVENINKSEKDARLYIESNKGKYIFDKVILATGSNAAPKTGSDGSGYGLAIKLGHKVKKPLPALCGVKCFSENTDFKLISGVRCQAKITLLCDDKEIKSDAGELQLADYGISGIPVFQLSGEALRMLDEGEEAYFNVDYAPEFDINVLAELIEDRKQHMPYKKISQILDGMFNSKLGTYLTEKCFDNTDLLLSNCDYDSFALDLAKSIKYNRYKVKGHRGFDNCQVCSGGIVLGEVENTLESKICNGVYFAGEILDVNGECGGYNLQWAWSSGYVAGLLL